MEVDAISDSDYEFDEFEINSLRTLWNGHKIEFEEELQLEVAKVLFKQINHPQGEYLVYRLAWLGSPPHLRPLIEKEIANVTQGNPFHPQPQTWEATGFQKTCKTVRDFTQDFHPHIFNGAAIVSTWGAVHLRTNTREVMTVLEQLSKYEAENAPSPVVQPVQYTMTGRISLYDLLSPQYMDLPIRMIPQHSLH